MPEPVEVAAVEPVEKVEDKVEKDIDLPKLVAQGKRDLLCGEPQKAVNQLQEACRLLAEKYGNNATECAEAYYLYGSALLDLSRIESGVLGNALQGITTQEAGEAEEQETEEDKKFTEPDSFTAEEREKISDDVIDAMVEKDDKAVTESSVDANTAEEKPSEAVTEEKITEEPSTEAPKETAEVEKAEPVAEKAEAEAVDKVDAGAVEEKASEKTDESKEVAEKATEEVTEKATEESTENGDGDAEAEGDEEEEEEMEDGEATDDSAIEEEEVSNLQLAWEMLELARTIYNKSEDKENKLRQADCLLKLGEIGMETEQHNQVIDDLKSCLALQETCELETTDRRLAETHYQLGLAYTNASKFAEAVASFRQASSIIDARIKLLTKPEGEADESVTKEISELKELLPEILNKIEDAEEDSRNADKVKDLVKDLGEASSTSENPFSESASANQSEDKPVTNVTHLVRRKRKPEDEDTAADDTKKHRTAEPESSTEATETPAVTESTETPAVTEPDSKPAGTTPDKTAETVNGDIIKECDGHVNGTVEEKDTVKEDMDVDMSEKKENIPEVAPTKQVDPVADEPPVNTPAA